MNDNNTSPIKLILVDDHQLVLDGIRSYLESDARFDILGEANDGWSGLKLVQSLKPQVVLLDLDMPVMNGITFVLEARKQHPDLKIIILSLHHEPSIIQRLLQLGVHGYLLKTCKQEEVRTAVVAVASGQNYFSPDVTLALTDQRKAPVSSVSDEDTLLLSQLTEREMEVLKCIGEGKTNNEIAEQLYISAKTVDTHRTHLMKKLGVNKVTGLIRWAVKMGLINP